MGTPYRAKVTVIAGQGWNYRSLIVFRPSKQTIRRPSELAPTDSWEL